MSYCILCGKKSNSNIDLNTKNYIFNENANLKDTYTCSTCKTKHYLMDISFEDLRPRVLKYEISTETDTIQEISNCIFCSEELTYISSVPIETIDLLTEDSPIEQNEKRNPLL